MANVTYDYFHGLYEPNLSKTVFMASSVFLILMCLILSYSIIWYERYGLDIKRTIINQLSSLQWRTGIEFILLVTIPEWLTILFGPSSKLACELHLVFSFGVFAKFLILQTGLVLIRYAWIFWLKNPLAFKDDIWCCFINKWSILFSIWPHFAFVFLPGRQQIGYYICIGQDPSMDYEMPQKINYTNYLIGYGSVLTHFLISFRIFLYKRIIKPIVGTTSNNLSTMVPGEKESLSGFITLTSSLAVTLLFSFLFIVYSRVEPKNYNHFPEYLLVYWIQLINAPLTITLLAILSYAKNPQMRVVMLRETKEFLSELMRREAL